MFPFTPVPGASAEDDGEKKKLRKKLKKHRKMLSDKADEHYEKGEKEMGKKYREMANKLSDDMDDEGKEMSLSDYEIDSAALSNPELSAMQELKDSLNIKLEVLQSEIVALKTAQLSANTQQVAKISLSKKEQIAHLAGLMDEAQKVLKGEA